MLVAGLLLVGLAAHSDGLFDAAGAGLARGLRNPAALFVGTCCLTAVVTAVLNLDTSVAFLTPVYVATAQRRGHSDLPLIYACLMVSNAASLLLPGSNLTNLIVLGQHPDTLAFARHTGLAWIVAVVITAAGVYALCRRQLTATAPVRSAGEPFRPGVGAVAILGVVVLVLTLPQPALPVMALGVAAVAVQLRRRRLALPAALETLDLPTLLGLLGIAVGLGALGRAWSGPARLLGHCDAWATTAVAAVTALVVNNLPAASTLSATPSRHPLALLVGLDLGPNLAVSGSLAWLIWLRTASACGARPSLARASALGWVVAPASMTAALGAILLTGGR